MKSRPGLKRLADHLRSQSADALFEITFFELVLLKAPHGTASPPKELKRDFCQSSSNIGIIARSIA